MNSHFLEYQTAHRRRCRTGQQGIFHLCAEGRHHQDQKGRNQKDPVQGKMSREHGLHIHGSASSSGKGPQGQIGCTGQNERSQAGPEHPADISVQIGPGQLTDQKSAGGHRGAPVPEKGAGYSCAACKGKAYIHCLGHGNTDGSHSGCRSKGSSNQKRYQAV